MGLISSCTQACHCITAKKRWALPVFIPVTLGTPGFLSFQHCCEIIILSFSRILERNLLRCPSALRWWWTLVFSPKLYFIFQYWGRSHKSRPVRKGIFKWGKEKPGEHLHQKWQGLQNTWQQSPLTFLLAGHFLAFCGQLYTSLWFPSIFSGIVISTFHEQKIKYSELEATAELPMCHVLKTVSAKYLSSFRPHDRPVRDMSLSPFPPTYVQIQACHTSDHGSQTLNPACRPTIPNS